MNIEAHVNAFEILLALAGLAWFFYGPWSRFVIDTSRQTLFEIRDEIFLLAADGKMDFDSPIYKNFRFGLNRIIRNCHHLTLPSMLFAGAVTLDKEDLKQPEVLRLAAELEDRELGSLIERRYHQAILIVVGGMVFRSAILTVLFMALLPILFVVQLLSGAKAMRKAAEKMRGAVERDLELGAGLDCLAT